MGEGGAVLTKSPKLKKIVESFRDWGRDCWCEPGKDNTCGKRFDWQLGALPHGYDHKYTYSHIGYNLKLTDMQAAVGVAQLRKLDGFVARRRENFAYLRAALTPLAGRPHPARADARAATRAGSGSRSPFAKRAGIDSERADGLPGVATRARPGLLFAGQSDPSASLRRDVDSRMVGNLGNADLIMNGTFWVGVYPGITREMLDYIADSIDAATREAGR